MYISFINFFLQDNSEENDAVLRGDIVNIVYDKAVEEIQGNFIIIRGFFFSVPPPSLSPPSLSQHI